MRNKVLVKIALILLVLIVISTNMSVCFAIPATQMMTLDGGSGGTGGSESSGGSSGGSGTDNFNFDNFENQVADDSIKTPVEKIVGTILSIIRIVGTGVAIIILAYFGMKYMMASPGERADFKKGAMQYVVGAIIVFGASNILAFLIPLINRLLGEA